MPESVDLTGTAAFYGRLLTEPLAWRRRHEIDVVCGSAGHVRTTSRYLLDFDEDLFDGYLNPAKIDRVKVFAPLGTRPKGPLLNPTFEGPFGPAHVSRRSDTSAMGADYLRDIAKASQNDPVINGLPFDLLVAICLYSPDAYREHDPYNAGGAQPTLSFLKERRAARLPDPKKKADKDKLGDVDEIRVAKWLKQLDPVARILPTWLGECPDHESSSENVLLAIAHLREGLTADKIDSLVRGYAEAVRAADAARDEELLIGLGTYGRRYELVLEVELPTSGPATITVSEDNRIDWTSLRRLRYPFPAGVAETIHLDFRVVDPAVSVTDGLLLNAKGHKVERGLYDALNRIGTEVMSFYSSVETRPDPVQLEVELAAGEDLQWTVRSLVGLNIAAILGLVALSFDGLSGDEAAVLVVPTTLAATFALFREQSTLATRLLKESRVWTAVSIGAVLAVAFGLLMFCGERADPAGTTSTVNLDAKIHQEDQPPHEK